MRALLVLVARLALARGFGYLPDSMDGCVDSMCEDGYVYTCATRYDRQYCEGTTYFDDHHCPDMSGTGCEGGWSDASCFTEAGDCGICSQTDGDDDYLVSLTGPYWHQRCLDDGSASGMYQASFFYDSARTSPTGNQGSHQSSRRLRSVVRLVLRAPATAVLEHANARPRCGHATSAGGEVGESARVVSVMSPRVRAHSPL